MSLLRRLVPVAILAVVASMSVTFAAASPAAATITVNTSDDELNADGDCSLREAVDAANTNVAVDDCVAGDPGTDTVVFDPSTNGNPIILGSPIVITEALVIDGNGRSATVVQGDEFAVVPGVTATFRDMTLVLVSNEGGTVSITNITATGEMNNDSTGAEVATMTISNSTLADVNNNSGSGTAETNLTITGSTGGFITNNSGSGTTTSLTVSGGTFDGIENNSGGAPPSTTTASISTSTINGTGGIVNSAGPGSSTTVTITNTTVTGATGTGIVGDSDGVDLTVTRSTVRNNGGNGIVNDGGTLSVANSAIIGNTGRGIVGAGSVGGSRVTGNRSTGIFHGGTVTNSVISGNGGTGIFLATTVSRSTVSANGANGISLADTVTDSNITGNRGTGIEADGPTVVRSTVSGNRGNGIHALFEINVINSTIAGNRGTGIQHSIDDFEQLGTVENSTITNNGRFGMESGARLSVKDTIVFGNEGEDCGGGLVDSLGGNIDGDGSCFDFFGVPSDQPNTDPLLGPLSSNGGPTRTQLPLPGSPAIDRGVNCPPPSSDQRGISRPRDGDGNGVARCDVGSVELAKAVIPTGGVDTGLGGTASRGWPVVPLVILGLVLSIVVSIRFLPRRS